MGVLCPFPVPLQERPVEPELSVVVGNMLDQLLRLGRSFGDVAAACSVDQEVLLDAYIDWVKWHVTERHRPSSPERRRTRSGSRTDRQAWDGRRILRAIET
jgi:hypothetical protein